MIAHHTSGGCNLRSGDLLGSGTISAPHRDGCGSMLELTRGGSELGHPANRGNPHVPAGR